MPMRTPLFQRKGEATPMSEGGADAPRNGPPPEATIAIGSGTADGPGEGPGDGGEEMESAETQCPQCGCVFDPAMAAEGAMPPEGDPAAMGGDPAAGGGAGGDLASALAAQMGGMGAMGAGGGA